MYTCGPTVWNFAHVGNLRAFLFYDLLRRHLQVVGHRVTHVMNLTDIDDRILDQAMHANTTIAEYVKPYGAAFFADMAALRAQEAEHYPKATEHIPEMVAMVSALLEHGNAYVADGDVYFRIASFPSYGSLSHLDRGGLRAGTRVAADKYDKESVSDFALWKKAQPADEPLGAAWDAPFGRGRPGWHIECSAMSKRYLGDTFDIHCGGIDLMFPHHENEIAQSEAANHKPFARVWLHSEHLADATGEKMSKSAGGFTTLRDLVAAGHDPLAVRFFLIANAHYRSRIRLSADALHAADWPGAPATRFRRQDPASDAGSSRRHGAAPPHRRSPRGLPRSARRRPQPATGRGTGVRAPTRGELGPGLREGGRAQPVRAARADRRRRRAPRRDKSRRTKVLPTRSSA